MVRVMGWGGECRRKKDSHLGAHTVGEGSMGPVELCGSLAGWGEASPLALPLALLPSTSAILLSAG